MRVLGRVERFRDRLQLEVRSLEAAEADRRSSCRRCGATRTSWTASSSSSRGEISHAGLRDAVGRFVADEPLRQALRELPAAETHHAYAGGLLEHTVGVATLCRKPRSCTRACAPIWSWRPRCSTTSAARSSSSAGRPSAPTEEGRLLGHVHLGLRLIEERAQALEAKVRAELLHAVAVHHEARGARTAEAAVLYHANQLDATAATRPVD